MSDPSPEQIAAELIEKCAKARVVLSAICERTWAGKAALKWSIPARPEDDDLVIADALTAAEELAALLRLAPPPQQGRPIAERIDAFCEAAKRLDHLSRRKQQGS